MDDGVVIKDASYPAEIAGAIIDTALSIGQLGKSEENKFGKYKYVSIDRYYEAVAQIALQHDLTWTCKEVQSRIEDNDKFVLKFTFMFTLIHRSGVVVPAADIISIYHQFQGAQTAGSAASYAEKLFMRKLFKVVTGEEDADATDPNFATAKVDMVANIPNETVAAVDLDFDLPDSGGSDNKLAGEKPKGKAEPIVEVPKEAEKPGLKVVPNAHSEEDRDVAGELEERAAIVAEGQPFDDDISDIGEDLTQYVAEKDGFKIVNVSTAQDDAKWAIVLRCFETFMPDIKTADASMDWWNANSNLLEEVADKAPGIHKKITKLFKETYNKLEKEAK
jgi:hypothetical protein